ncbi:MAG: hypothetical protein HQM12_03200 [SAR324 cluster bacterium]|nr:hypothetical protein [SAR324 cluster bacterium]
MEAEKQYENAQKQTRQQQEQQQEFFLHRPPGRTPDFQRRIDSAVSAETMAKAQRETTENRRLEVRNALEQISQSYHLYDLNSATPQKPEEVGRKLREQVKRVQQVAQQAKLPEKALKKIQRVLRLVDQMQATLVFVWFMIGEMFQEWGLSKLQEDEMRQFLIPAMYFQECARKCSKPEEKRRLREKADQLLRTLIWRDAEWRALSPEQQEAFKLKALNCAQLFQRSSSAVEGRNGQQALRHHTLHQFSDRRLEVLTCLHNYFIKRPDGTTAAQRFFQQEPQDLFQWLLLRMPPLSRPAASRKKMQIVKDSNVA